MYCSSNLVLSVIFGENNMAGDIHSLEVTMYPDGRMDRKNAARYLGLSVKTLAMHACRGTGPKFVKRGRVFYFRQELDAWLKAGEAISTAQATQKAVA
jgi:hypothetical protein